MRQKRAKNYRKQMATYHMTFKFREPYQVVFDDQIVEEAIKCSFDLIKGVKRTIQGEFKPMITQCAMQALYKKDNQTAISLAKTFERRRCNHQPSDPLHPSQCIHSITNINGKNKHRYIIATQDMRLRKKLRTIPGVPLIYMYRSVMLMEPISHATEIVRDEVEEGKLTGGLNDINVQTKRQNMEEEEEKPRKKRKGPKAPNPLSVKKPKPKTKEEKQEEAGKDSSTELPKDKTSQESESSKKRRRKRSHKSSRAPEEGKSETEADNESAPASTKPATEGNPSEPENSNHINTESEPQI